MPDPTAGVRSGPGRQKNEIQTIRDNCMMVLHKRGWTSARLAASMKCTPNEARILLGTPDWSKNKLWPRMRRALRIPVAVSKQGDISDFLSRIRGSKGRRSK